MFAATNFQDAWFYRYGMLLFSSSCAALVVYVCLFPRAIITSAHLLRDAAAARPGAGTVLESAALPAVAR